MKKIHSIGMVGIILLLFFACEISDDMLYITPFSDDGMEKLAGVRYGEVMPYTQNAVYSIVSSGEAKTVVQRTILQQGFPELVDIYDDITEAVYTQLTSSVVENILTTYISYPSKYGNKDINASMMLMYPSESAGKSLPVLLYLRDFTVENASAPSHLFKMLSETLDPRDEIDPDKKGHVLIASLFASAGFAVLMPDYIGFGENESEIHPYFATKPLKQDILIGLKKAKLYFEHEGLSVNYKYINIFGHGEGAQLGATVLHALETEAEYSDYTVKDVVLSSGVYNLQTWMANLPSSYGASYYIPALYQGFVAAGELSDVPGHANYLPADRIFKSPYDAVNFSDIFGGTKTLNEVAISFETDMSKLLTDDFRNNLDTSNDLTLLRTVLSDNEAPVWIVAATLHFSHSTNDEVISSDNSDNYHQKLMQVPQQNAITIELENWSPLKGSQHKGGWYITAFKAVASMRTNFLAQP